MRERLAVLVTASLLSLLVACGGGGGGGDTSPPIPSVTSTVVFEAPSFKNVSTMVSGQPFTTTPNFTRFGGCSQPCSAGVYPNPNPVTETSSMTINSYPLESYPGFAGNKIDVICQVYGKAVSDDQGDSSSVWDMFLIPREELTAKARAQFSPKGEAVYGFTPDKWMQDTGFHGLLCKKV